MILDEEMALMSMNLKTSVEYHQSLKFMQLMKIANINHEDIKKSLNLLANKNQVFKAGESSG